MTSKKSQRKRANPVKKQSVFESKGVRIGIVIIFIAVVAIAAFYLFSGSGDDENGIVENGNGDNGVVRKPIAVINTSMGTIKVEHYEDKVPNTCENFINYANDGFYDGLVFHRVIDNFMIQGGGFGSDGAQHNSDQILFESNPDVRHVDGVISMASTAAKVGGTNQFFICDGAQHGLDDDYAAFGVTIEGMDVVRDIAALDPEHTTTKNGMQNWPEDDVIINSIAIENQ